MINIRAYREYLHFALSVLLFLSMLIFLIYLYFDWTKAAPPAEKVEVSLPLIDWQRYSNLSKQYSNGKID